MNDLNLYAKNEKGLESLVQTVEIFSDDIAMEFGISKCAVVVLRRRKITKLDGISLSHERVIIIYKSRMICIFLNKSFP